MSMIVLQRWEMVLRLVPHDAVGDKSRLIEKTPGRNFMGRILP